MRARLPKGALLFAATFSWACTDPQPKPVQEPEAKPVPAEADGADGADAAANEAASTGRLQMELTGIRAEANALFTQAAYDEAKTKIEEGLAIAPRDDVLLRLEKSVAGILSHRCCGKWLRYDLSQPDDKKKHLSGVLYSKQVGQNARGHDYRGRVLIACDKGTLSMRLRVPWQAPKAPSVTLEYKLGEGKGTEKVTIDPKKYAYILPEPQKWIKRLGQNEDKVFEFKVPKLDGSVGEFSFELGKAQEITSEVLAACK